MIMITRVKRAAFLNQNLVTLVNKKLRTVKGREKKKRKEKKCAVSMKHKQKDQGSILSGIGLWISAQGKTKATKDTLME